MTPRRDGDDPAGDGRFIDPELGELSGEAASQAVPSERALAQGGPPLDRHSGSWLETGPGSDETHYYGRPVLKEPTWVWSVPGYFYAGGAAGAALVLGAAAQAVDRRAFGNLVRRCRWLGTAGGLAGTALLIHDLGRRERFLNMLRVFRPSSPMSVGSWVLAGAVPLAAAAAVLDGRDGAAGAIGDVAGAGAGLLGMPLAGYTAVLLSNTAVPVWQETARTLPVLFVASAAASAASLLELAPLSEREDRVVRRFGLAAEAAELIAMVAVQRDASSIERVGRPLREGASGALWRAGAALTAASLVMSAVSRRSRWRRATAGLLGTAGALAVRFAMFHAGRSSARDPLATFHQQRAGRGATEITRSPAVTGPDGRTTGLS